MRPKQAGPQHKRRAREWEPSTATAISNSPSIRRGGTKRSHVRKYICSGAHLTDPAWSTVAGRGNISTSASAHCENSSMTPKGLLCHFQTLWANLVTGYFIAAENAGVSPCWKVDVRVLVPCRRILFSLHTSMPAKRVQQPLEQWKLPNIC